MLSPISVEVNCGNARNIALIIFLLDWGLAVGFPLPYRICEFVLRRCSKTGCSKMGRIQAEGFLRVDADLCRWGTACHPLRDFDRIPTEKGAAQIFCQPCGRCSFPAPLTFFYERQPGFLSVIHFRHTAQLAQSIYHE